MKELSLGILQWLSNFVNLGVFITDKDFNVIFWNHWMSKNTGLSEKEAFRKNIFDLFPDLDKKKEYYQEVLQGRSIILSQRFHKYLIPIEIEDKNFKYMQQTVQIFPFTVEEEVVGTITIIEDVTERVKGEEEYKRQIRVLKILNEVQNSVLSLDLDQCLEEIINGCLKLKENIIPGVFIKKEDYLELVRCKCGRIEKVNIDDSKNIVSYSFKEKKTVYIPDLNNNEEFKYSNLEAVSILAIPLFGRKETLGVLVLESEKKDAFSREDILNFETLALQGSIALENAELFSFIRESEERYRILAENSFVGVFLVQEDKIIYVNPKLLEILGYSFEEFSSLYNFLALIHQEDREKISQKYFKLLANEINQVKEEGRFIRKDGSLVYLEIFAVRTSYKGKPVILGTVLDLTDRKNLEEELRRISITDPLTGLYNRRGFMALAEHMIEIAKRNNKKIFIMFLDLDHMKWINDNLGHNVGDLALQEVARVLKSTFRKSDILARIGGDEFIVMGMCNGEDNKDIFLSRIYDKVEGINREKDRLYNLSLSIGTIIYNPEENIPLQNLIDMADELMYEDKRRKKKIREEI